MGQSCVPRSRGSTHRSPTNPLGRQDSESVRQGTILANRALVILFILAAKGCWTILEQPASSCMEHLPLFQYFLRLVPQVKMFMRMGDHGGPTPKPTLLYSSHACIAGLNDFRTMPQHRNREITVRYTNRAGEKRWHGGKDMKGSQSYPRQFGVSLARLRTLHEKRNKRKAVRFLRAARRTTNDFDTRVRINKAWTDGADLSSVISYLSQK
ncbi:Uncharacterized protein SCF082_LOCUS36050 [Durusdinium trenchii]|uniref:Uncharacterized protein n=1 Tax=Durusdinium trenchii TaxID=1381693 RepID=A0ABP0PDP8_9DINO